MKTNDLPLITPAVLKASQKNAPVSAQASTVKTSAASSPVPSTSEQRTTFTAEVVASQPQPNTAKSDSNTWQITIRAEARHLMLQSEHPLPKGSQLTLTTDHGQPPKVEVVEIKLPAKTTSTLLQSLAAQLNNNKGLPAPVQQMLSARIQWQHTPTTSSNTVANTTTSKLGSTLLTNPYQTETAKSSELSSRAQPTTGPTTHATSRLLLQLLNRPLTPAIPSPPSASTTSSLTSLAAALPGSLPQLAQAFVQSQPTATQLAQPEQIKTSIENSPLRYEQQVLSRLSNSLTGLQPTLSTQNTQQTNASTGDTLTQVFKQLWARTATPSSANPAQSNNDQSDINRHAASTPINSTKSTLTSLIAQMRGNAPTAITNTLSPASAPSANNNANNSAVASASANLVLNAAVLSFLAGFANDEGGSALPMSSTHLSPMNLKGLLLNLVRHWPADLQPLPTTTNTQAANNTNSQIELRAETFRLIQTALSQIEHEQVRLTQSNDQFQVPLMWRDGLQLQQALMDIKQDRDDNKASDAVEKKHRWQITLHFDLSGLGPLDIELDLCLPGVSATFWSERSDTLASLNHALQPLRQTLTELGANVGELKARHGRKPAGNQPTVRHSLVDIHT